MKKTFAIIALAFTAMTATAIPARHGVTRTATDIDGNSIELIRSGDEFLKLWKSTDGTPYRILDNGTAIRISDADMAASVRKASSRRRASISDHNRSQVPHIGTIRVPILLVDYKDKQFRDGEGAKNTFDEFFQNGNKSARQYFIDNSNGRFTPEFDVYGPFHLSGKRATYGANDRYGDDIGMGKMVGEACQGLDNEIDFSRYDNDGDGICDVVIVLYAGEGEASSDVEDAIWPAQWALSYSDFGRSLRLDGVTVNDFAVFNELNGINTHNIDGIGTFCHEFSHCLGLPDFYDTSEYGTNFGMGPWSLMDYGSYNDNTYTPIGYSAYEKWFMGWIDDIPEPKPGATLSFPVFNQKKDATDVAYRLINDSNKDEYFILENRAQQGWDAYIPTEGLMIYHVDYDETAWYENSVNNYNPERMAIVAADDRRTDNTESGDLFPYRTNNSFTDTSSPSSKLNNGGLLRKPVTEIVRNPATGIVTCRFMPDALPELDPPSFTDENRPDNSDMQPYPEGFTAVWPAAPTDKEVTYTLEVRPHSDKRTELIIAEDCTQDSYSWESDGYVSPEDNSLHMGSGNNIGALISPAFDFSSADELSVLFRGKAYGNDYGVSIRVCLLSTAGIQLSSQSVDINSGYQDFAIVFKGVKDGSYKVRIETLAKKKRMNLKWVKVYSGDATELLDSQEAPAPAKAADGNPATEKLTFTGLTDTMHRVEGLTPGGIYDWRVRTVPVDASEALPSAWSEFITIALPMTSGTSLLPAEYNTPEEYFDLSGHRICDPAPGIYIRRQGSKTSKVIIR